ncbi:MAG: TlpA family protein disulfide reductase [Gammaproteobacteria bacterium]
MRRIHLFLLFLTLLLATGTGSAADTGGLIGRPAPDCTLEPLSAGAPERLSALRGSVVYVDFWASWCTSCVKSFPFLGGMEREFGSAGLRVVGVNLDEAARDATDFIAAHPVGFALAADRTGDCPRAFQVRAMPSSFLVDRSGIVRHVHLGFRAGDERVLRAAIESLLTK